MRQRTIPSELAKELVGAPDALTGPAKFLWSEHKGKTLFAGITKGNLTKEPNWNLSVGTLIWVPCQDYVWHDGLCGWTIEDLIRDGLHPRYWRSK